MATMRRDKEGSAKAQQGGFTLICCGQLIRLYSCISLNFFMIYHPNLDELQLSESCDTPNLHKYDRLGMKIYIPINISDQG
jgi:hypothetical protein